MTPDGQKIHMIFGDNLCRLPMWSDQVRHTNDETSPYKINTLALVPTATALEVLAHPSLPDQEAMQLVHDMWTHMGVHTRCVYVVYVWTWRLGWSIGVRYIFNFYSITSYEG